MTAMPPNKMLEHYTPRFLPSAKRLKFPSKCMKVWLVTLNSIFTLMGGCILGLGCVLKYNSELIHVYIRPILGAFKDNGEEISLQELYDALSVIFVAVGTSMFIVGFLGCFGAWCNMKSFLLMYIIILMVVTLSEIVCAILLLTMKKQMDITLQPLLKAAIQTDYTGDEGVDVTTIGMNYLFTEKDTYMINKYSPRSNGPEIKYKNNALTIRSLHGQYDCCGVHNYTDLHQAENWIRDVSLYGLTFQMQIPLMCCKLEGTYPNIIIPDDKTCTMLPDQNNSFYHKGCYYEVENSINKYQNTIIGAGVCVLIVEIISIVSSIYLLKELLFLKRKFCNVTPVSAAGIANSQRECCSERPHMLGDLSQFSKVFADRAVSCLPGKTQ
ncbi:hypothetical protein LOTGIDRAFT_228215 [Lottia gigantea]|uniref:Uncharacterized protein n=1 Tax=Lottia gigantea TaxID=225164 RepID=V4ART6_LOTGI|nr:hypothetical protein LOTGIDRAFT_228215 [Lottia gigantea]ESO97560.1 hypothetical protein LOTGIDRAFT_228215 [Lottia gigantea]